MTWKSGFSFIFFLSNLEASWIMSLYRRGIIDIFFSISLGGGVQGSSLTFGDSGFDFGMGFRPPSPPAPAGVLGSALIQRLLPSRFSVGASWNRMNAGYEPEPTTQGL